jgi:hypothetical protein
MMYVSCNGEDGREREGVQERERKKEGMRGRERGKRMKIMTRGHEMHFTALPLLWRSSDSDHPIRYHNITYYCLFFVFKVRVVPNG